MSATAPHACAPLRVLGKPGSLAYLLRTLPPPASASDFVCWLHPPLPHLPPLLFRLNRLVTPQASAPHILTSFLQSEMPKLHFHLLEGGSSLDHVTSVKEPGAPSLRRGPGSVWLCDPVAWSSAKEWKSVSLDSSFVNWGCPISLIGCRGTKCTDTQVTPILHGF